MFAKMEVQCIYLNCILEHLEIVNLFRDMILISFEENILKYAFWETKSKHIQTFLEVPTQYIPNLTNKALYFLA